MTAGKFICKNCNIYREKRILIWKPTSQVARFAFDGTCAWLNIKEKFDKCLEPSSDNHNWFSIHIEL